MRRGTAASYLDMTPTEFDREVMIGRVPMPVKIGNHEHWSRVQLDQHIAELYGEMGAAKDDWRKRQPAYAS